jgi:hypothetical protein
MHKLDFTQVPIRIHLIQLSFTKELEYLKQEYAMYQGRRIQEFIFQVFIKANPSIQINDIFMEPKMPG